MKTFQQITKLSAKDCQYESSANIEEILISAYYNQVNKKLEESYCDLLNALLEYSQELKAYISKKEELKKIIYQINLAKQREEQNSLLAQRISNIHNSINKILKSETRSNEKNRNVVILTQQIETLNRVKNANADYIEKAPGELRRDKVQKEVTKLETNLSAILEIIERIVNKYLIRNKQPLINEHSELNKLLDEKLGVERNILGRLIVAYLNLIESLGPKLIEMANNFKKNSDGSFPELSSKDNKILDIINELNNEYSNYIYSIHSESVMQEENVADLNANMNHLILLLELMKEYLGDGELNEEKLEAITLNSQNAFGIPSSIATDICMLSRNKKEC